MNETTTTIRELIETLQELADELGDDCEVRLATQPNWPFEHSIGELVAATGEDGAVVYIGEGQQLGYLPRAAARELGWGRR